MGKYIGRWQHPVTLAVRVWPCSDGARRLTCEKTRIPILGISMEKDGRVLAYHEPRGLRRGYKRGVAFELPVESVDAIAAVEACGGRMDVKGMYVKAPGSSLSQFKQESWLEIPVIANADAKRRRAKEGESLVAQVLRRPKPRAIYGESPKAIAKRRTSARATFWNRSRFVRMACCGGAGGDGIICGRRPAG